MPSAKVWLFGFLVFATLVVGLWYLGGSEKNERVPENPLVYTRPGSTSTPPVKANEELAPETERRLQELLAQKQAAKGSGFAEFDTAVLSEVYPKTAVKLSDNATSSWERYGRSLAQILKPLSYPRENEGEVLLKAFDKQDEKEVAKLITAAAFYQKLADEMIALPTPPALADLHRETASSLRLVARLTADMGRVLEEPVLALQSGMAYASLLPIFYRGLDLLNQHLVERGLVIQL